eukprot:1137191-Pelagomonas_calceolata.AAC.7
MCAQATPGVVIRVSGPPKDAAEQSVSFTNGPEETRPSLALVNRGDWTTMNVTLPEGGWSNASFTFYVPVSYDDLSAAVTMVLWEGQELPEAPPPPVGTVCATSLRISLSVVKQTCASADGLACRVWQSGKEGEKAHDASPLCDTTFYGVTQIGPDPQGIQEHPASPSYKAEIFGGKPRVAENYLFLMSTSRSFGELWGKAQPAPAPLCP